MQQALYSILPDDVKQRAKKLLGAYRYVFYDEQTKSPKRIKAEYSNPGIEDVFNQLFPDAEYQRLMHDFESSQSATVLDEYDFFLYPSAIPRSLAKLVYAVVRVQDPNIVIETGVANGVSSMVILQALTDNGDGHLYSIDLPNHSNKPLEEIRRKKLSQSDLTNGATPSNQDPGWIIPSDLTARWELTEGKVQKELPPIINQVDEVDLCHFDAEHTTPAMLFEYEISWPKLPKDGLILCDDVLSSEAFFAFSEHRDSQSGLIGPKGYGYGYLKKNVSE